MLIDHLPFRRIPTNVTTQKKDEMALNLPVLVRKWMRVENKRS